MEVAALLALAQDHAFAQPSEAQLWATVLGQCLAQAAGVDADGRAATWWTSALRFLGCQDHAFETAVVFGDEIELRARSLRADFADPAEVLRLMVERAGSHRSGLGRIRSVLSVLAGGQKAAELNFRTACEVADVFAVGLGFDEPVREALATTFERWNGRGRGSRGRRYPVRCGSPSSATSSRRSRGWRESRRARRRPRSTGPGVRPGAGRSRRRAG